MSIAFPDLPENLRVRLEEESEKKLWTRVEKKGIEEAARRLNVPQSRIYNWRSKNIFIPIEIVKYFLESPEIVALKGLSRSRPTLNPVFPFEPGDELQTRIKASVSVNKEGVPVYRTDEKSLLERFKKLLRAIGEVPLETYNRHGYELRYPKYIQEILSLESFEQDFGALVDECGGINDTHVFAGGRSVKFSEFDAKLFSRRKRFELALKRGDDKVLEELISEESERVRSLFR